MVVAEMTVGCGEPFGVESKDARGSACLPNRNDEDATIVVEFRLLRVEFLTRSGAGTRTTAAPTDPGSRFVLVRLGQGVADAVLLKHSRSRHTIAKHLRIEGFLPTFL